jgi:hypothetical protein
MTLAMEPGAVAVAIKMLCRGRRGALWRDLRGSASNTRPRPPRGVVGWGWGWRRSRGPRSVDRTGEFQRRNHIGVRT